MILHAQAKEGQTGFPWLVFLHGFSGDYQGWQTVGEALQDYSRLYIDLPGHDSSADISVNGFDDVSVLLRNTLLSYNIFNCWLMGYSLGDRVVMMAACQEMPKLCGLVVEGGHPDLQSEKARIQRRLSGDRWTTRFHVESLREVFNDWYQQPVFSSLNAAQREALVTLRDRNNGQTLAAILEATSSAIQPDSRARLTMRTFLFYYLYGKRGDKFRALAVEISVPDHMTRNTGHNVHRNSPAGVVDRLTQILRH